MSKLINRKGWNRLGRPTQYIHAVLETHLSSWFVRSIATGASVLCQPLNCQRFTICSGRNVFPKVLSLSPSGYVVAVIKVCCCLLTCQKQRSGVSLLGNGLLHTWRWFFFGVPGWNINSFDISSVPPQRTLCIVGPWDVSERSSLPLLHSSQT